MSVGSSCNQLWKKKRHKESIMLVVVLQATDRNS